MRFIVITKFWNIFSPNKSWIWGIESGWEQIKYYDLDVIYQQGRANVVANASSSKLVGLTTILITYKLALIREIERLKLGVVCSFNVPIGLVS